MSESDPQSLKNHGRLDPSSTSSLLCVFVNLGVSSSTFHHLGFYAAWLVFLSMAVFVPYSSCASIR